MKHSITRELDQATAWAVVLAGGGGTRVQSLTRKSEGDRRPKQFCGGRSLLGDTKPPRATARELVRTGGLWNTFVTIGRAGTFLNLLCSAVPTAVAELAGALELGDVERAYRDASSMDFSKDVLSVEPRRLLVMRDAASGWADLDNPDRVVNTLVQNQIGPGWLLKLRGSYLPGPTTNSRRPRRRRHHCSVVW